MTKDEVKRHGRVRLGFEIGTGEVDMTSLRVIVQRGPSGVTGKKP